MSKDANAGNDSFGMLPKDQIKKMINFVVAQHKEAFELYFALQIALKTDVTIQEETDSELQVADGSKPAG